LWLRDGCVCPQCRHPKALERTFNLLSVPQDIAARYTDITPGGSLRVVWSNDEHVSEYDPAWFADFESLTQESPRPTAWGAKFSNQMARFRHAEVIGHDTVLRDCLGTIRDAGIALIQNAPCNPGEVTRLAEHIAYPKRTNFGTVFDVVSMANPNGNTYTGLAIHGHSDLAFYKAAPGFFVLHCLTHDAEGGQSTFADGFGVAQALRESDPQAYEILTRIPFEFRFEDDDSDFRYRAPVITVDQANQPVEICFNISVMHSPLAKPAAMAAIYRAYRKFAALMSDPAHQMRFRLAPGEVVGFDNARVLHGRTAFDETGGHRHLQGIYVDRDEFLSRIRTLERRA